MDSRRWVSPCYYDKHVFDVLMVFVRHLVLLQGQDIQEMECEQQRSRDVRGLERLGEDDQFYPPRHLFLLDRDSRYID